MGLLSKTDILAVADLTTEDVPVPEWGGTVRVRCLNGDERDTWDGFRLQARESKSYRNFSARLVGMSVVDADGKRLFSDEEIALLAAKSGRALDRVFAVAVRLSGLNAEHVEEAEKNSASGQSGDSGSA